MLEQLLEQLCKTYDVTLSTSCVGGFYASAKSRNGTPWDDAEEDGNTLSEAVKNLQATLDKQKDGP